MYKKFALIGKSRTENWLGSHETTMPVFLENFWFRKGDITAE